MNITEFSALAAEKMEKYLREEMQEDVAVRAEEVMKLNDRRLYGLCFEKGDEPMPTYYLNDLFERYLRGADPDELVRELAELYQSNRENGPVLAEELPDMHYRNIRRRAGLRLVGMDHNREYLKTVPFKDVGNGYALICDVQIKASDGGLFSTVVTNDIAQQYGYDMEKLFKAALDNAWKSNAALLRGARELSFGYETENGQETCYVLTTDRQRFGAAALFYPGTQAMIAHVLGEDYIAIPSSLHEFIILRESSVPDPQQINHLVREANSTIVGPDEVLSENILKYSKSTGKLSLLTESEEMLPETEDFICGTLEEQACAG